MHVGYSEFSFGYAFTENLVRSSPDAPLAAPIFPNLNQEGQFGWDINIQFPTQALFFQFKLPEFLRRRTAYALDVFRCAGLDTPFFRIKLMRRSVSDQHALLMQLENANPDCVFYAAPCLESASEFNGAYNAVSVARRSVFISPNEIGPLPDDKDHKVSYRESRKYGCFMSEPKRVAVESYSHLMRKIVRRLLVERLPAPDAARQLRENVLRVCSPAIRQAEPGIQQRMFDQVARPDVSEDKIPMLMNILVAREIARIDLGVEVIMAQLPV